MAFSVLATTAAPAPAVTFHDLAYLPLLRTLKTAIHITTKAQQHAADAANASSEADLVAARLVDDMYPFHEQLFQLRKNINMAVQHLRHAHRGQTGQPQEPVVAMARPPADSTPTTFAECLAILDDAMAELTAAGDVDGHLFSDALTPAPVHIEYGPLAVEVTAKQYMEAMILPNANFHVVTAYGILRSRGVPLGKGDFMGPFFSDYVDLEQVAAASAHYAAERERQKKEEEAK
ncbi:DUF1993 family protein [Microdochium nivale]|nr:DUF1993 family protein [Microdochium nivale]